MENKFKRFLSLVVAMVMVFCLFPMNVFATEGVESGEEAVVADLDFTNATDDETGEGWTWDNANKTLSLNNASITSPMTLPMNSTIQVGEGTVNSILVKGIAPITTSETLTINGSGSLTVKAVAAEGEAPAHTVSGASTISVNDTNLTTYGYAGLSARYVYINRAQVDIRGYGYGIYSNQSTGSSLVVLNGVSGSITGELDCGIELYVESNKDNCAEDEDAVSLAILDCKNLTINGELNNAKSSNNGHRSGIWVRTKDAETDAVVQIEKSDIAVNGSGGGINVNSHSDNSASDDASSALAKIIDSNVDISTITNTWAAIFVNNNGTGEKATSEIIIDSSNVKALCPNDVAVMTSTKDAASLVTVKDSTLDMSGAYAGIRAKAISSDAADIVVEKSVVVVTDSIASNYVGAMDEMDNGTSADATADSATESVVIVPVNCEITDNGNGTWEIPVDGTVIRNGVSVACVYGATILANGDIVHHGPVVDTGILTVDGVWFDSFDEAKSAIKKDSAIVLYDDVENNYGVGAEKDYKFPGNGNITLELNGHTFHSVKPTVKGGTTTITIGANTTLTVTDSVGTGSFIFDTKGHPFCLSNNSTLILPETINFEGTIQLYYVNGQVYLGDKLILGEGAAIQTNEWTDSKGILRKYNNVYFNANGDITLGGGSFTLNEDFDWAADRNITVPSGITVDLNGNDLTAKNIKVNGNLIDTADGVGAVSCDNLLYAGHNNANYLPIADGKVYRLFAVELMNLGGKADGTDKVKFGVRVLFDKAEAYLLLADSIVDGSITANAIFAESGDVSEGKFSASVIVSHLKSVYAQVMAGQTVTKAITGRMTMTDNTVDLFAELFSGETNVVITSDVVTYTK